MRLLIFATLLLTSVVATVCLAGETPSTSLVTKPGYVPYYSQIDDALKAAKDSQFVVIEFYTDW